MIFDFFGGMISDFLARYVIFCDHVILSTKYVFL